MLILLPVLVELELTLSSSLFSFPVLTVAAPVPEMVGLFLLIKLMDTFTFGEPRLSMVVSPNPRIERSQGSPDPRNKTNFSKDDFKECRKYPRMERLKEDMLQGKFFHWVLC